MEGHGAQGTSHGASSKDEEAMDSYLRSEGLYRKRIAKDGSCLFRAVAEQVLHSQTHHLEIRKSCIKYLRENRSKFEAFIEGSFEDYMKSLENPQEWVGQVEISALSMMFKRDFVIYQEPNAPPSCVTGNGFPEKILLCFSNGNHYDIIYPISFIDDAALCQSLVYELLYENVLNVNLGDRVFKKDFSSLTADAYKSDGSGSDGENQVAGSEKANNGNVNGFKSHKNGKQKKNGLVTVPQSVQRSLNPLLYRNVEYEVWQKSQKDQQKLDFSIAAGMQYSVGDKCLARLEPGGKFYGAHIQEVGSENGPVVVFIEELATKQAVQMKNLKPIPMTIGNKNTDGWNTVLGKKDKKPYGSGSSMAPVKEQRGQKGTNKSIKSQAASSSRLQQGGGSKTHAPPTQSSNQTAPCDSKGRSRTPPKVPVRKLERERSEDSEYFKRESVHFGLSPEERREKEAIEESKSLFEIQSRDEDAFPALSASSADSIGIQNVDALPTKKLQNPKSEKSLQRKSEDQKEKASKLDQSEKSVDGKAEKDATETLITSVNTSVLPSPPEQPAPTTVPFAAPTETAWPGIPEQIPASPGVEPTMLQSQVTAAQFSQFPVSLPAVNQPMMPIPQTMSAYHQDPLYPGFPLTEQNESAALPPYSLSKSGEDLPTDKSILRFFFNLGLKAYMYNLWPPQSYLNPLRQAAMCRTYTNVNMYPQGPWVSQEAPMNQSQVNPSAFVNSQVQPGSGNFVPSPTLEVSSAHSPGIAGQGCPHSVAEAKIQTDCQVVDFGSIGNKSMIPHSTFGHGTYMGHIPIAPTFFPPYWYGYPYQAYFENPVVRHGVFISPQSSEMPEIISSGAVNENNLAETAINRSVLEQLPSALITNNASGSNYSLLKEEDLRNVTHTSVEQHFPTKDKPYIANVSFATNFQAPLELQGLTVKAKDIEADVSVRTTSAPQALHGQQDLPEKATDIAGASIMTRGVPEEACPSASDYKGSTDNLTDALATVNVQANVAEGRPVRTREESSEDEREVSNMLNSGRPKNYYSQTYGSRRPRNEKYYPPSRGSYQHVRSEEGWRGQRGRGDGYPHYRNYRGRPYRRRTMGGGQYHGTE
uniref:OTU domain-containing protein 4 n=1 Tax=Leptobrachium leishanense TaxID=445787 RepID=A0A8C5LWT9_9ANUR